MNWIKDNLVICAILCVILTALTWEFYLSERLQVSSNETAPIDTSTEQSAIEMDDHPPEHEKNQTNSTYYVDVKGEIQNPDVYQVDQSDRVIDVIEKAGGFNDEADTLSINLAERVYDEMVITVYPLGEENESVQAEPTHDRIRINIADQAELERLPGIGESKAQAILAYRDENGPFHSTADLENISGIGAKTVEQLEDYIQLP
ncbi:competence protein ComEA [Pelagirhabdus alkalitolerans]|uniref:Competence protein ComEA n=1 Tax=Pelagirhabdus alkalitolerans TaxID=1612202 RepID=A0A1G6HU68_9BACI|nr:ComEA family DNA-binding protein [Pelagirhabdus alkalitolerans]SDB97698.1 competence protein ComEA [Pelagirhabdus alkalitolerans]